MKPIKAGFAPKCITELKIARFVSPFGLQVPMRFILLNPVMEFISAALSRFSKFEIAASSRNISIFRV
jgi:hypothetical protein